MNFATRKEKLGAGSLGLRADQPIQASEEKGAATPGFRADQLFQASEEKGARTLGSRAEQPILASEEKGARTLGPRADQPIPAAENKGARTLGPRAEQPIPAAENKGACTLESRAEQPIQTSEEKGARTLGSRAEQPIQTSEDKGACILGPRAEQAIQASEKKGARTLGSRAEQPIQTSEEKGACTLGPRAEQAIQASEKKGARTLGSKAEQAIHASEEKGARTVGSRAEKPIQASEEKGAGTLGLRADQAIQASKDKASATMETRQQVVLRLLDHILQPSVFEDVRTAANSWRLEQNQQQFTKAKVVDLFLEAYHTGMLPRGEVFVDTNSKHVQEAIKVFHLLYFAKDWDVFLNVACWLRERINPGMFVSAFTTSIFHRPDTNGIILPAPYEIYPYLFVNSDVINKAFMMKMANGQVETAITNYWKIKTNKNVIAIDSRTTLRYMFSPDDVLSYYTEDIDLNAYLYYLYMSYPSWMTGQEYAVNKERRGEAILYTGQQILARLRLERLSLGMQDITPISWDETLKTGYWPKIRLHTGDEMPARSNYTTIVHDYNVKVKEALEDFEKLLRLAVLNGKFKSRDGTTVSLKKPQDVENLARLLWTDQHQHFTKSSKNPLSYSIYNCNKYTYVPTASDMYSTFIRDPAVSRVMKRKLEIFQLFKKQLPSYTREELGFPGVKVQAISTTELVTFMDTYDMDISNAVYLNEAEVRNKVSDFVFVARQRRLNTRPFKVTIDVASTKVVDAVIRVFLGPKYDLCGRFFDVNDKRLDMIEIDTFLCMLNPGKNSIVRNSTEFQGIAEDRPWTRPMWDASVTSTGKVDENWWWKSRVGYPHRLLLPLGHSGGMDMQLFVVVTSVQTGYNLPVVDMHVINERHTGRWSTGFDSLPLGFPFDRVIDPAQFFTDNMMSVDVKVYHKEIELPKNVEATTEHRDDLSIFDKDLFL